MTSVSVKVEENNMEPEWCVTAEWCGKEEKNWEGQKWEAGAEPTPSSNGETVQ